MDGVTVVSPAWLTNAPWETRTRSGGLLEWAAENSAEAAAYSNRRRSPGIKVARTAGTGMFKRDPDLERLARACHRFTAQ